MTTLTVIQARTGSTRLPDKVLKQIDGLTILEWVIHRLTQTDEDLGTIIVATTARAADNAIADVCTLINIPCYRSSEHDVLNRFHQAAIHYQADTIVRITADCPLLCPQLLAAVITLMRALPRLDYAGVKHAPNGLGQEALSVRALEDAWHEAKLPDDREHVVTYIEGNPDQFHVAYVEPDEWIAERAHWRLTVDEPDDLDLLRRLYDATDGELFDLDSRRVLEEVEAHADTLALATRHP